MIYLCWFIALNIMFWIGYYRGCKSEREIQKGDKTNDGIDRK